jgi:hypothetical protein
LKPQRHGVVVLGHGGYSVLAGCNGIF